MGVARERQCAGRSRGLRWRSAPSPSPSVGLRATATPDAACAARGAHAATHPCPTCIGDNG
eukprot:3938156-Alexandrium_andersonii.AAC.1